MQNGNFIIALIVLTLSCITTIVTITVYVLNIKSDLRVYQERLKASEVLVEHLIQEGIKFKDKQHIFDNTLTKIDSWQGETTRVITSWRDEFKKEYNEIKSALDKLAA